VLCDAQDGTETLGGLRAGEIHEEIEKGLFEQQHAADGGDTRAKAHALPADCKCPVRAAQGTVPAERRGSVGSFANRGNSRLSLRRFGERKDRVGRSRI
jgi:hypothetical protein